MLAFQTFVRKYLNFTTREKIGIAGLLVLIAVFRFLPDFLYSRKDYSAELEAFQKEIATLDTWDGESEEKTNSLSYTKDQAFEPFFFDPNTIEPNELKKFGIPGYVIERFAKFRKAGAKFYKKEDLKKLYGLKPELYERMEPYIRISSQPVKPGIENKSPTSEEKANPHIVSIELNSADSSDLLKVKGIGPYLSSKIIKYRNALGGFVSVDQLYEIYNIKPEQVDAVKPILNIDPGKIIRININTADYVLLNGHPYISGKEANAIIQYRKQHGLFNEAKDLDKVYLLNQETIKKILPYIEF